MVVCRHCGEALRQSSYASLTFWTHEDGNVACHWGPRRMSLYGTNAEPKKVSQLPGSRESSEGASKAADLVQDDEV